ncbi:hypothetical protein Tco_1083529 [Tanacetum coccineum]
MEVDTSYQNSSGYGVLNLVPSWSLVKCRHIYAVSSLMNMEYRISEPVSFIFLRLSFRMLTLFDVISTPMDTSEKLMLKNGQAVSQLEYSRVIGSLMYAMICTRPNIAFVVGKLSRYTSNLGTQQWQAIQQKDTLMQAGLAILKTIRLPVASAATLAKAYSQMYNGKSRHLGVRHSMNRELITNGVISIEFVMSQQNLADHSTKGLARDLIIKSAEGMGLKSN